MTRSIALPLILFAHACFGQVDTRHAALSKAIRGDDHDASLKLVQQLLSQTGNDGYQYLLGWHYHFGKGVSKDLTQAQIWYEKAADRGNAEAQPIAAAGTAIAFALIPHMRRFERPVDRKVCLTKTNDCDESQCIGLSKWELLGKTGRRRGIL